MVILETGGTFIRDSVASLMTTGQYGSDGTTESEGDTALGTPIAATQLSLAVTKAGLTISTVHELDSVTGNGNTLREFAVKTASGDLTRATTTDLVKDNTKEVVTTNIFFVSIN